MGRENRRLYVPKYKLHILFGKKEKSIDYFEIEKGDFIFNGIDVFESDFSELFHKIKSLDETLESNEEEGFESKKLGFGVSRVLKDGRYLEKIEFVSAFPQEYSDRPQDDVDDIIKHYLGE